MQMYNVNIDALFGRKSLLIYCKDNEAAIAKVKEFIFEMGGGSAEVFGNNFYTIIDL